MQVFIRRGIHYDMTFASVDLLARVKAPYSTAFRRFNGLATDDAVQVDDLKIIENAE